MTFQTKESLVPINQLMLQLQMRIILLHHLSHHLPPQPTRRQYIRLIQTPHFLRRICRHGQMCSKMRYSLNLRAGVRLSIPRLAILLSCFFPLAEIDTAGQFADDGEVDAAAYFGFERGDGDEGIGGEVARAQVAECGEGFA